MERDQPWYQRRFGIEPPFPWIGIGLAVTIALIAEAGMAFGVLSLFDCDLGIEF